MIAWPLNLIVVLLEAGYITRFGWDGQPYEFESVRFNGRESRRCFKIVAALGFGFILEGYTPDRYTLMQRPPAKILASRLPWNSRPLAIRARVGPLGQEGLKLNVFEHGPAASEHEELMLRGVRSYVELPEEDPGELRRLVRDTVIYWLGVNRGVASRKAEELDLS